MLTACFKKLLRKTTYVMGIEKGLENGDKKRLYKRK